MRRHPQAGESPVNRRGQWRQIFLRWRVYKAARKSPYVEEVAQMTDEQKYSHITTEREKASVPVSEKYMLTIKEAAEYFSIGTKKMRRLAEDNLGSFAVYSGNRYLIIRTKFEKFVDESSAI